MSIQQILGKIVPLGMHLESIFIHKIETIVRDRELTCSLFSTQIDKMVIHTRYF